MLVGQTFSSDQSPSIRSLRPAAGLAAAGWAGTTGPLSDAESGRAAWR